MKLALVTHPRPIFIPSEAFVAGIGWGGGLVKVRGARYHLTSLAEVIKLFGSTSCAKGHLHL